MRQWVCLLWIGMVLTVPRLAQGQVGVISGTLTAGAGGVFTICVNADGNVKGMAGLSLEFHLPKGVTVVGIGKAAFKGGDFTTGALTEANTNDPAVVRVAIVRTEGKNGPISIGCIDVNVLAGVSGDVVTLVAEANDIDSNPIPIMVPGSIVCGSFLLCTPPPPDIDQDGILDFNDNCPTIANPTQKDSDKNGVGDACSQVIVEAWDVNRDGVFNISDIREAIRVLLGQNIDPDSRAASNADGDGDVDLVDIRRLLKRVLGIG